MVKHFPEILAREEKPPPPPPPPECQNAPALTNSASVVSGRTGVTGGWRREWRGGGITARNVGI